MEFLLKTPTGHRKGWVFNPKAQSICGDRMRLDSVSKVICEIGEEPSQQEEKQAGKQERDTLRDTSPKPVQNDQEPPDVSSTPDGS